MLHIQRINYVKGISFLLISTLCMALLNAFAKPLLAHYDFTLILFLRFALPGLILLWFYFLVNGKLPPHTGMSQHWVRSCFTVLTQCCLLYALIHGSLIYTTLLMCTSALFIPLISRIIFKTELPLRVYTSVVLGFAGVAMVLHPGAHSFSISDAFALAAGFFSGCVHICNHRAVKMSEPIVLVIHMYWMSALLTLPILLVSAFLHPAHIVASAHINLFLAVMLGAYVVASITNQLMRSQAYKCVNKAASLSPFLYTAILFSVLIGWAYFNESVTWHFWVGFAMIVAGSIITTLKRTSK
jgi:drug/metabolite transporter (DMT)-like permease